MTPSPAPHSPSEIDFAPLGHLPSNSGGRTIDIVHFALSIWKPLAIGLGGGILLGICAYLFRGPTYEADTRILVRAKSGVSTREVGGSLVGDRAEHVTLIRSDSIVHLALTEHGLAELPAYQASDDPIEDIIYSLKVTRSAGRDSSKDNVFDIVFTHRDPETARQTVTAIIDAYRTFLSQTLQSELHHSMQTSQQREAALRQEVKQLELEHARWRDGVPHIFRSAPVVNAQGSSLVQQNRWEQELDAVAKLIQDNFLARRDVEAKLSTLRNMLASGQPRDVIEFYIMHAIASTTTGSSGGGASGGGGGGAGILAGPPAKTTLDTDLMKARMQEAMLLHLVGPDHDSVKKARRQIETILGFYRQHGLAPPQLQPLPHDPRGQGLAIASGVNLPQMYEKMLENQLEFLSNQEAALREQLDESEQKAKQAALLELEDQRRKEEIAAKKKELERLVTDIADFMAGQDSEGFLVQPIAQVRVGRSLKQLLKLLGVFAAAGMCTVFGLAYFREWYDSSVRTPEEVRRAIGATVLGAVPHFLSRPNDRAVEQATGVSAALHYYHRPGSREAEAFRSIRTTLFAATKDSGHKVIQVCSPEPGDGKTTSACNLAVAIAQSGQRVLLIDADLRRPTVHTVLGLRGDVGLSEVLRREIDWEHALQPTRIDGLTVLPCGRCPENPAELLSLATLGQVLRQARADYDYILVDTPPVLAVSDPCIVSPHVDGMLLVVRMFKNKRAALTRTREALETHGVALYGVLANDLDLEINGYGSGNYAEYYRSETGDPQALRPLAELQEAAR